MRTIPAAPLNGWRQLNYSEQHLRIQGKIVGKIYRPGGSHSWECRAYFKRTRRLVGWRVDEDKARALVEAALGYRRLVQPDGKRGRKKAA